MRQSSNLDENVFQILDKMEALQNEVKFSFPGHLVTLYLKHLLSLIYGYRRLKSMFQSSF